MNQKLKIWQGIARDYCKLIVPNRPSHDDCQNYGLLINQALKNKKKPRIMVTGSTPELRSLLFVYTCLYNAQVYCVDFSEDMYKAMTDFISKKSLKEKFVKADWLNTKFKDNFFDLVVGDEVICNISIKNHSKFFQEIKRILKKDCFWITRHNIYLPDASKTKSIVLGVVRDIAQGKYGLQTAINYLFILLFYKLVRENKYHKLNQNRELTEIKKVYRELSNKKFEKEILKQVIYYWEDNWQTTSAYYWHVLSKKDSEEELREFFVIKEILYAYDYITAKNSPVYLLKPNI